MLCARFGVIRVRVKRLFPYGNGYPSGRLWLSSPLNVCHWGSSHHALVLALPWSKSLPMAGGEALVYGGFPASSSGPLAVWCFSCPYGFPVAHAMVRNACLPPVVPDIEVKVCSSALRNSWNLPLSCGFNGSPVSAWLWQNVQGRNGTSYRYFPQPIRLYLLTVSYKVHPTNA